MRIIINSKKPEKELIVLIVKTLKKGGVIIYPTDTVYGIGCDVTNKRAVERIYRIKKRRENKPMSFICADFKDIGIFANMTNEQFRLMKKNLPGPFTFVLKSSSRAPKNMVEKKRRTIGVRIPDNKVCLEVVKELGSPITTTSANVSGAEVVIDLAKLSKEFINKFDLVVDAGILDNISSTVVDLSGDEPVILRAGKGELMK